MFKFRLKRRLLRHAGCERHHDLDLRGVDAQALRQLLARRRADRDDPPRLPQRPAVEAQGDEPLGKGVEVRITQEIEVGNGHHRRNAPQVYGERQRGSEAVVQVEVPIALCVNDIFMFRSVILQHPGQVLKVIAPERDRGRIESYFHCIFPLIIINLSN